MLVTACSTSSSLPEDARAQPIELTPAPSSGTGTEPTAATPPPESLATPSDVPDAPQPESGSTLDPLATSPGGSWAAGRTIGECFDSVASAGSIATAGPAVDCDGPHEYEIVLLVESADPDGAPYQTSPDFLQSVFERECVDAVETFAGAPLDAIPFTTRVWAPSLVDWEAGDRTFGCVAGAARPGENRLKVGTAAAGDLRSDEGIVASAVVQGASDLHFSFQHSTLYPLTNGQFTLRDATPFVLGAGFLFASPPAGESGQSQAYDFNFDTGQLTLLETGLEGWAVKSPGFVFDPPTFVLVARESVSDDWDIYATRSIDEVVPLTDNEIDDRRPSVLPDESAIVYDAEGDIWIMGIDGSDPRRLTSDPADDVDAAVSPDGTMVAFTSNRTGDDEVWLMDIDGSNLRNVSNHPANDRGPFFDSSGTRILFETDRLGVEANIMVVELDGSNASYFSTEFMTNGAVLPQATVTQYKAELAPISRQAPEPVSGVVSGDQALIVHSAGGFALTLPGGWEFQERAGGAIDRAVLVAAPSISNFDASWAADGVLVRLVDADSAAAFEEQVAGTAAAGDDSCRRIDADADGVDPPAGFDTTIGYECGEIGMAVVSGTYDAERMLGVVFEGQWDSQPSGVADAELLRAVATSVQW